MEGLLHGGPQVRQEPPLPGQEECSPQADERSQLAIGRGKWKPPDENLAPAALSSGLAGAEPHLARFLDEVEEGGAQHADLKGRKEERQRLGVIPDVRTVAAATPATVKAALPAKELAILEPEARRAA